MACIFTVDSHMNYRANMMTIVPLSTHGIHHACVANANHVISHFSPNALTCDLFHITNRAAIGSFIGESITQSGTYWMSGIVLNMCCKMQQVALIASVGMNCRDFKLSMSQSAGFIKNHSSHLRQRVHIV